MQHSSSSVFMTTKHLVAQKSITEVPNQKVANQPKHFLSFFFFFSYFSGLNLRVTFMTAFLQNSGHITPSSAPAHLHYLYTHAQNGHKIRV